MKRIIFGIIILLFLSACTSSENQQLKEEIEKKSQEVDNYQRQVGELQEAIDQQKSQEVLGTLEIMNASTEEFMPAPPSAEEIQQLENLFFQKINQARYREGLPSLARHPLLAAIAKEHSRQMEQKGFYHAIPGEKTLDQRIKQRKIYFISSAETVSLTPFDTDLNILSGKMVQGLLESPGHRATILDYDHLYTNGGVGIVCSSECFVTFDLAAVNQVGSDYLDEGYSYFLELNKKDFDLGYDVKVHVILNFSIPTSIFLIEGNAWEKFNKNKVTPPYIKKYSYVKSLDEEFQVSPGQGFLVNTKTGEGKKNKMDYQFLYYP